MLKKINIEDPEDEAKKSRAPKWVTDLIQTLKDNTKIVIGVTIGIILLGKD